MQNKYADSLSKHINKINGDNTAANTWTHHLLFGYGEILPNSWPHFIFLLFRRNIYLDAHSNQVNIN